MNHDLHTGRPERRPVGTIAFPDGADFAPEMTPAQVGAYSTLALAHIGEGARVNRGLVHRNPAYDGDARAPYEHGHPPAALARHAVAVPNRKQGYF